MKAPKRHKRPAAQPPPARTQRNPTLVYEALLARKLEIERALFAGKPLTGWVQQPDRNGWWLWLESGYGSDTELLLLSNNGATVASDDEFSAASGQKPPAPGGATFNYWEDTDTTQKMMPGKWLRIADA